MRRIRPELKRIDQNLPFATEAFVQLLQQAVLLAIKDSGLLNMMQYRYAVEKLRKQRRTQTRKRTERGTK